MKFVKHTQCQGELEYAHEGVNLCLMCRKFIEKLSVHTFSPKKRVNAKTSIMIESYKKIPMVSICKLCG